MTQITSEQLRDISVTVVEQFLNNKIPLSLGLAKQAAAAQLNSDQIKRAVEATNTIAYLKVLSMSDDRTVEFPLAKYAEVMRLVTVPDDVEKQAGWHEEQTVTTAMRPAATADADPYTNQVLTGVEKEIVDEEKRLREEQEKMAYFIKEAAMNRQALEDLEAQKLVINDRLVKLAKVVADDEKGMDKLASVVDGEEYAQLSVLVTGELKPHRDFGGHALFKEAELKDVNALVGLFKEAKRIVAEAARRSALQKRAEEVSQELTKEAFIGSLAGGAGKILGKAMVAPFKAVAKAPARMAGRSIHNTFGPGVTKVQNMAGSLKSKVTGKPFTPKTFTAAKGLGLGAALYGAGSVAVDAAMYNPGRDAKTGRSNDVWSALQRD